MEGKKSFWNRYRIVIASAVTIFFIYLIVLFNQNINFFLGNELAVYLTPSQNSFYLHYGNISKIKFNITIDNVAYCGTYCNYTFSDISRNETIDKGNFGIDKYGHFLKNYNLTVKRLGSGQDIYSFDVVCHNIRKFLCLTRSPETFKSSLVVVNYDLTETDKELKKILKQNVTKLLEQLSKVDALHQQVNQKYLESEYKINLNNLSNKKIGIDVAYNRLKISIDNLRSAWGIEEYTKLNQLFNESFSDNLGNVKKSIVSLESDIMGIARLHNDLLIQLKFLAYNLDELKVFIDMLEDNQVPDNFNNHFKNFIEIASSLVENKPDNYTDITKKINNLSQEQVLLLNNLTFPSAALFFDLEYSGKFGNDLLCSLQQNCTKQISIKDVIEQTQQFIEAYPNAAVMNQSCTLLRDLNQAYSIARNKSIEIIEKRGITFPNGQEFSDLAANFIDDEARKLNNSYLESLENFVLINSSDKNFIGAIGIANSTLPKYKSNLQAGYNQTMNISLYLLSKINLSGKSSALLGKCVNLNKLAKIDKFNFEPISTNITYNVSLIINTTISDNPPICCVFNECKPCCMDELCKDEPETFPTIFLHGHSVARAYSPEFSLDAFDKMQSRLQEEGYLNAGVLIYSDSPPRKGEWGLVGKPVTVRTTYYYDVYRKEEQYYLIPKKSESIDTYAIRLNDIIDVVKEKTGKSKVNIIAFSMGGLVARRNIQIFGDGSVYKLITIGTPHKGIVGAVAGLCPVIGENKECADMQKDSLFLNKLNDPDRQPLNVKIYNIIGKGCLNSGQDGDGIVLAEQASLKGVAEAKEFFINSTCTGAISQFHTDLIDTDKFPETYRIIKEILKK